MTARFDILPGLTPTVVFETGTTFEVVPGGVLTETATTTYTLSAASGSYFITGSSATPKLTLKLPLTTGAYSLTGSTAATFVTRKLAATSGGYALTGSTATTVVTRRLAAATGAFALTGSAAQVFATRKLAAASGAYALTGQNATLTPTFTGNYTLAGATGHYTLSGSSGTLTKVEGSAPTGNIYTVSGPQVIGYLPLQDGVDQVRAVNFPGSTVQRQTTDGTVGPVPVFQSDFTAISVLPAQVTLTRASAGTYFDSSGVLQSAAIDVARFDYDPSTLVAKGLLIEEARTNLFLTSTVPANQTITVVNATSYTVSFYGTGSLTLTGAVSHTVTGSSATVLTSYNFTSATTSLVITVAGSVVYPNVEAGDFATSRISTAGSPVSRSADLAQLTGTALTALKTTDWTLIIELTETQPSFYQGYVGGWGSIGTSSTNMLSQNGNASNQIASADNETSNINLIATLGSGSVSGPVRVALGRSAAGRSLASNGGTTVTDANPTTITFTQLNIGAKGLGNNPINGHIAKLVIYSSRLSDATLQIKSVVGAAF